MPTRALVLVFLFACGGSKPEPQAAAPAPAPTKLEPTCESAMQHAVELVRKENDKTATPDQILQAAELEKKLLPVAIAACTEDKWSAEVVRCFEDSQTEEAQTRCELLMTKEQTDSLDRRLEAVE